MNAARPTPSARFQLPLVVAALAVGFAIQVRNGEYSPGAIALIGAAIVCTGTAIYSSRSSSTSRVTSREGGAPADLDSARKTRFGGSLALPGDYGRWASLGLVLIFLPLGLWAVHVSPAPHVDTWVFERDAAIELLHGRNPYAMTFPDIYHSTLPGYPQQVYGSGLVVNDRCQFGFPYPPVTLLLTTFGYLVGGDPRYAQVIALAVAGALIGFSGRGLLTTLAVTMLLFTPRVFFVLSYAWTEPFVVMLLAVTVLCACRKSRWLPVALGLFLATKQYLILAVPLTFFLLPSGWTWRDWIWLLAKAALVAAIVTLPFALWDFPAFWKSTVTVQQIAPFRWDSLSFIVWWGRNGHGEQVKLPNYAALPSTVASMIALLIALRRCARTPAGFAASLALVSLAFFAFNKQAFANYYFFVIGAICCAIAASAGAAEESLESAPVSDVMAQPC